MKVLSVNIAAETIIQYRGKSVKTGIVKKPVNSITLDFENVVGDTISDRRVHGGINKAVYGYSVKHYNYWKEKYSIVSDTPGFFGENITFDELDESLIHIGDQFQCGDVIIEATEPRFPCFKLGAIFETQKVLKEFMLSGKSGVYFKVLATGEIASGDEFIRIKHALNNDTIASVFNAKNK